MNKQEFDQVGGFPMTTRTLSELQKAFTIFNSLGALAGDKTVISGCETVGSLVNDGFVYVAGEVFEFRGGGVQAQVKIFEISESLIFGNNESKEVIKTRYVSFGSGVGAMNWSDFKRGLETKSLEATFTSINNSLTIIANKLGTIDENAKIQVPSDWNANSGVSRILNKPTVEESGILFTGSVLANGNKTSFYKRDFAVEMVNGNQYKITHNLGHINYAITGAAITHGHYKVAMWSRSANECVLGVSDDDTANLGDFAFICFKL